VSNRNQLPKRKQDLLQYFDAREQEMSGHFDNEDGAAFGIEVVQGVTDTISIYIPHGRKLTRKRAGVGDIKELFVAPLASDDLSGLLHILGRSISADSECNIRELDQFLEEVHKEIQSQYVNGDNRNVKFAVIHDCISKK
jgi:hypothetical protein